MEWGQPPLPPHRTENVHRFATFPQGRLPSGQDGWAAGGRRCQAEAAFLQCAEARAGVEASHCTLAALAHLLQRNLHNSLTCQYNTPWTPVDCSDDTQSDILGAHLWNLELFSQTSLRRPYFLFGTPI